MFQINLMKVLWLKELKALCHGHIISDFKSEEIVGTFYKKEMQKKKKKIKKILELKK